MIDTGWIASSFPSTGASVIAETLPSVTSISVRRTGSSELVADDGLESGAEGGGDDWAETGRTGTIKKAASANERLRNGMRVMFVRVVRFTRAIVALHGNGTVAVGLHP